MQLWRNILKDIQKNEKNVKNSIIAANNHYAGFGPMTAKLFAEMMNLKNHVRPFPLVDYKISSSTNVLVYFKIIECIKDILKLKLDKLIFLNFSNNMIIIQIFVIAVEYF